MNYDFSLFKKRGEEVLDWLSGEFSNIRTGRATPSIIEKILVDAYGNKTPIVQLASINVEDPRTLRVVPWDKTHIGAIQGAIDKENIGVSCAPDDTGLRVIFPEMTEENRKGLAKIIKERLEEAKVSLRKEREDVWNDIVKKEKDKELSEDDKFRLKDELQKLVDEYNKKFEEYTVAKEKEVLEV